MEVLVVILLFKCVLFVLHYHESAAQNIMYMKHDNIKGPVCDQILLKLYIEN
jgi:hypothetical protein